MGLLNKCTTMMQDLFCLRCISFLLVVFTFSQCETSEVCASCLDPDFTVFLFDTTAGGFNQNEIDSFYIIGFFRGELSKPIDTTELFIEQNPFSLNSSLFNSSTLTMDYIVEGVNQEFRFEITDLGYSIKTSDNNCQCDLIEDKSLVVNDEIVSLAENPFEVVVLGK